MEPIVSTRWLLARLYEPELVIVDCRFYLLTRKLDVKPIQKIIFPAQFIYIWKNNSPLL